MMDLAIIELFHLFMPVSLLADPTAAKSGNINAAEQVLGPLLTGIQYNSNYGNAASRNQTSGWQRVGTTSNITVGGASAFENGSYVEYAVTATGNNYMQINLISVEMVGGGTGIARVAAMYSINNFATMDSFTFKTTYNAIESHATQKNSVILINGGSAIPVLSGQQVMSFTKMGINVNPGQTFKVRFYVWLTGSSVNIRHLGERNMVTTGRTNASPVPMTFKSTRAVQKNNGVEVEWSLGTELNVNNYNIVKSKNGKNLSVAGTMKSLINISGSTYTWFDANPANGHNFYRIKFVDLDGSVMYGSLLKVSINNFTGALSITPNPVLGSNLNLNFSNLENSTYNLQLFNVAGQKIFTRRLIQLRGSSTYSVQLPALKIMD